MRVRNVFTVPAGVPFAKALAGKLLEDTKANPEKLARYRVFLPTRRACAILKDSFLQLSNGKPLLLPRLQPLGDIDEEELSLSLAAHADENLFLNIPPALSPLRRRILLARTIEKLPEFTRGFDQALALSDALGRLMDQVYIEGLEFKNLDALAPDEFSAHWQITTDFLKILSEQWPKILAAENLIDGADRRNRLIRALSGFWQQHPPAFPVIAAGSTGSIPATADLLTTIAGLDNGTVILPGLDQEMDEESWNAVKETHPQYGLRHLLQHMNLERDSVKSWPHTDSDISKARRMMAREIMRPAKTSAAWADLGVNASAQKTFKESLENLRVLECTHEREEADVITLLLRETLEDKNKTAALITPDRNLARRVATACGRWNIAIDDSAGQTLDQTLHGSFLRLCVQAAVNEFSPVSLLALLKHKFSACGYEKNSFTWNIFNLEKTILRGPRPARGLDGIFQKLKASEKKSAEKAAEFLRDIEPVLQRFKIADSNEKYFSFGDLLKAHLQMAEGIATTPHAADSEILWGGESGEAAAELFANLMDYADLVPSLSLQSYGRLIEIFMQGVTVRPSYGMHPRLKILGQLEARLNDADLVIMAGLNEGTWPPDPGHDPWMSRPMRKKFGLPGADMRIGQAAHDFVQAFCAPEVVITRAARSGGAPSVPSRWLLRLETVLQATGIEKPEGDPVLSWATAMDETDSVKAYTRPAPKPPVSMRPRELYATRVEEWMRDPYSTYARYILKLRKLEPLEKMPDAAERGKLLHEILKNFVAACPDEIPPEAEKILYDLARTELEKSHEDPAVWSFWWPRFVRITDFLLGHEIAWREDLKPVLAERDGEYLLNNFKILAKPDRIDGGENGAAIIDYKSGGTYTYKGIKNGDKPQLSLEALILKHGGFPGLPKMKTYALSYWLLTGGADPGKIITVEGSEIDVIIDRTEEGLQKLIAAFDEESTPYYSLPRPGRAPDYNDYEHLARVQEWTVLGDGDAEVAHG